MGDDAMHNALSEENDESISEVNSKNYNALVQETAEGLFELLRDKQRSEFITQINKVDSNLINHVLVIQDYCGETLLHSAAQNLSYDAVIALIEKVDQKALENVLVMQDYCGETLLHSVVKKRSCETVIALIEKVDQKALENVLIIQGSNNNTLFHIAASRKSPKVLMALIAKLYQNALSQALVQQNKNGCTPLHIAARIPSKQNFMALIENLDQNALSEVLVQQNENGCTPLYLAEKSNDKFHYQKIISSLFKTFGIEKFGEILRNAPPEAEKRDFFIRAIKNILDYIKSHKSGDSNYKISLLEKLLEVVLSRLKSPRISNSGLNFKSDLGAIAETIQKEIDKHTSFVNSASPVNVKSTIFSYNYIIETSNDEPFALPCCMLQI